MAKPKKTFRCRVPKYRTPRLQWRQDIKKAIVKAKRRDSVGYNEDDQLEVHVRLYMSEKESLFHDIDNRLKDIFDTLQGRMGGPKGRKPKSPLIHNDSRICRVVAVKMKPPKQSHGEGHLKIQPFRHRGYTF